MLVERHQVTLIDPVRASADLTQECAAIARQWLNAHGLDADLIPLMRDDGAVSVMWEVVIGHADPDNGARDDRGGVPWRWSARVEHWMMKLDRMRRAGSAAALHTGLADGSVVDLASAAKRKFDPWGTPDTAPATDGPLMW